MVGLYVQQSFLPFFQSSFSNNENFKDKDEHETALQALFNSTDNHGKGKKGFKDLIKYIKNDGNSTIYTDIEEILKREKVLQYKWKSEDIFSISLASGLFIYLNFKRSFRHFSCQIEKKYGFQESIADVASNNKALIFLMPDNRIFIYRKDNDHAAKDVVLEQAMECYSDFLPSLATRRFDKKLCIKEDSYLFAIWWSASKDDVFPWSPRPEQRANILIYSFYEVAEPQLYGYLKTDSNLLQIGFIPDSESLYALQQGVEDEGKNVLKESLYEIVRINSLETICETIIPLQSELRCFSYDETTASKLALGCCDSSLTIYSQEGKITQFTNTAFIPSAVKWHYGGFLVCVIGDRGQFQIFDIALNPLLLLNETDQYTPSVTKQLFITDSCVNYMSWCPLKKNSTDSKILIKFNSGAMIMLKFPIGNVDLHDLCHLHLMNDHYSDAIKVLKSVQWNSDDCLHTMNLIYSRLISQPQDDLIEHNLEHLLAIYFIPSIPIDDEIKRRHSKTMRILGRKYFMWLLQFKKYSRALQIAISLKEDGLLCKLQVVAKAHGEIEIANEAGNILARKQNSSNVSSESDNSKSTTSSCSSCESEDHSQQRRHHTTQRKSRVKRPRKRAMATQSDNTNIKPHSSTNSATAMNTNEHMWTKSTPLLDDIAGKSKSSSNSSSSSTVNVLSSSIQVINLGPV